MKLINEKRQIEGNVEGESFKIQASAKAFQVLSDRLYTNKVRAIIRELCTNAFDSHIEAGKSDVPFRVKLPNELEPTFYVEDFGIGMSERVIMELYSSYFSSDKTDSNEAMGAFGLGSKSPFAYADMFTVRSRYNGWEGNFHCYLNEDGVPCIAKIDESETSEPNGVKVEIAVNQDDFYNFYSEAESVLRPFKVKPEIKGHSIIIKEYNTTLEGKNWMMGNREGYGNDLIIVQGCVEYPLRSYDILRDEEVKEILKEKLDEQNLSSFENIFNRNQFVIWFPIGKLDVAPSREALSLDKRTKNNLINGILKVYNELITETFKNMFDDNLSLWEIFGNVKNIYGNMDLGNTFFDKYTYKGNTLSEALKIPDVYKPSINAYTYESYGRLRANGSDCKAVKIFGNRVIESLENLLYASIPRKSEIKIIYHNEPDNERSAIYRLKQHIREHNFSAIVISDKNFIDYLGITDYENISDYEYIKKPGRRSAGAPSGSRDKPGYFVYQYSNGHLRSIEATGIIRSDFENNPVYMNMPERLYILKHYNTFKSVDILDEEKEIGLYEISKMIKRMEILTEEVYEGMYIFVMTKMEKKSVRVKNDPKWKPVIKRFQEILKNNLNDANFRNTVMNHAKKVSVFKFFNDRSMYYNDVDNFQMFKEIVPAIVNHNPDIVNVSPIINEIYKVYTEIKNIKDSLNESEIKKSKDFIASFRGTINVSSLSNNLLNWITDFRLMLAENRIDGYNLENMEDRFKNRYPMMKLVNGQTTSNLNVVDDYIKLVESV